MLGRPVRQRPAFDQFPQPPAPERRIGQHADAALLRQREDALLHRPVVDRVVDADEVDVLFAHVPFEIRVLLFEGGGQADVADAAGGPGLAQDGELGGYVAQVVDLHQVDGRLADAREGRVQLGARGPGIGLAAAAAGDVELGRPEQPVGDPGILRGAARDLLRGAIARRGVEHAAALAHQRFQDVADARGVALAGHARERGRAAQAHHRQLLRGAGDRAGDERLRGVLRQQQPRTDRQRHARRGGQLQVFAPGEHARLLASRDRRPFYHGTPARQALTSRGVRA